MPKVPVYPSGAKPGGHPPESCSEATLRKPSPEATLREPSPEATLRKPCSEATLREPSPEATLRKPSPEATLREPSPKATLREPSPEATLRKPSPEATLRESCPEATLREPSPEATLRKPSPEATLRESCPEATLRSPVRRPPSGAKSGGRPPEPSPYRGPPAPGPSPCNGYAPGGRETLELSSPHQGTPCQIHYKLDVGLLSPRGGPNQYKPYLSLWEPIEVHSPYHTPPQKNLLELMQLFQQLAPSVGTLVLEAKFSTTACYPKCARGGSIEDFSLRAPSGKRLRGQIEGHLRLPPSFAYRSPLSGKGLRSTFQRSSEPEGYKPPTLACPFFGQGHLGWTLPRRSPLSLDRPVQAPKPTGFDFRSAGCSKFAKQAGPCQRQKSLGLRRSLTPFAKAKLSKPFRVLEDFEVYARRLSLGRYYKKPKEIYTFGGGVVEVEGLSESTGPLNRRCRKAFMRSRTASQPCSFQGSCSRRQAPRTSPGGVTKCGPPKATGVTEVAARR
ncbi:hypothetical protein GUJ93_ZPchr0013g37358 [Zizania palustris]|uniref:Uncharacterized protein n=1 Tax=Zizania palustris TaxID=103762 RepID=A0A8J6BXG7_ZIZPA|nr:hypothetical protein GUJ93_ZPchr0013g37358 [Zizania palustris]